MKLLLLTIDAILIAIVGIYCLTVVCRSRWKWFGAKVNYLLVILLYVFLPIAIGSFLYNRQHLIDKLGLPTYAFYAISIIISTIVWVICTLRGAFSGFLERLFIALEVFLEEHPGSINDSKEGAYDSILDCEPPSRKPPVRWLPRPPVELCGDTMEQVVFRRLVCRGAKRAGIDGYEGVSTFCRCNSGGSHTKNKQQRSCIIMNRDKMIPAKTIGKEELETRYFVHTLGAMIAGFVTFGGVVSACFSDLFSPIFIFCVVGSSLSFSVFVYCIYCIVNDYQQERKSKRCNQSK